VPATHLQGRHRAAVVFSAAALLAFGALTGLAWSAGFVTVFHRFIHMHWWWVPIALGAEVLAYAGYIVAYREVARAEDGEKLGLSRTAAAVATGFGVFVAPGGFALDEALLRSAGVSPREARARVLGLGALEYAVLAPAAMAAALYIVVNARPDLDEGLTFPWIVGVPLGFAAAVMLMRLRHRLDLRRGWRAHLANALEALSLVRAMAARPFPYGLAFAGIALYWLGDIACLWAALHVFFQQPPPVAQLVIGYATGYALTRRTLPIGGAGIVDALLPLALGWVGIALAPAVLAVLVYRFMNLWLPVIPALAGLPTLRRPARHVGAAV
jgi:Lysylphosphatidylglycerol synthase TM region